jgi:putative membrane protein
VFLIVWLVWLVLRLLVPLAVLALVVWLVVRAVKGGRGGSRQDPLDILKVRYARGEISREEYDRMKNELGEGPPKNILKP